MLSMTSIKLKPPTRVGRYRYEAIATEVARAIARGGPGTHKKLAAALGLSSQQLSHRLAGTYSRFSLEDMGIAADFFASTQEAADYGRGWPLMSSEESRALWGP